MTKPHIDIDECVQRYIAAIDELGYIAEQLVNHAKASEEVQAAAGFDYLQGLSNRLEDLSGDINDLVDDLGEKMKTLTELKQIAQDMLDIRMSPTQPHPFIGQYVIARCYSAGVHAGEVVSVDNENVVLKDSRRLWNWKAKEGVALSGLAQSGLTGDCKIDTVNPLIYLTGVCELIPCAKGVRETIHGKK